MAKARTYRDPRWQIWQIVPAFGYEHPQIPGRVLALHQKQALVVAREIFNQRVEPVWQVNWLEAEAHPVKWFEFRCPEFNEALGVSGINPGDAYQRLLLRLPGLKESRGRISYREIGGLFRHLRENGQPISSEEDLEKINFDVVEFDGVVI